MENILKYAQESLFKSGAEKVQCSLTKSEKHELNVVAGEISLFRTTFNNNLSLTGILQDKKGSTTINKLDKRPVDAAVKQVIELAESSQPDPANDISEKQPAKEFSSGPEKPDLDKMYSRMTEFMAWAKETYPDTILEELIFDFTKRNSKFINSNGVEFTTRNSLYTFVAMFTTKKGKKTSSFNYSFALTKDLDKPFKELASFDRLMQQSSEQTETHPIPEKFVGNVIITPDCMDDIIGSITRYLYDYPLITKTSVYKDKLKKVIADSRFTLHSKPLSKELAANYFVTPDGFEAKDSTVIDKGILKTFLLGLYGSKKTGLPKAVNMGGNYIIEPGDVSYEEIIKSTRQGILLCRFSGGNPSDNGDFSGVAKNSYYIENGEIKYPISETMVSGNLVEMLKNIKQISSERVNSGYHLYPWIKFEGLTVSGKGEDAGLKTNLSVSPG